MIQGGIRAALYINLNQETMKKVYGMPGIVNAQIVITSPSGKTKYKIPFTGGSLNDRNKTEAKFITDNEILQNVIERDARFNKSIFLRQSFGEAAPTVAAAPAPVSTVIKKGGRPGKNAAQEQTVKENATEIKVMEEVTDMEAAIVILTEAGEVAAADVLDVEGVQKKAREMGFSFPNLK